MCFSQFLLLIYLKTLDITYKTNIKDLKGGDKKAYQLGASEPKKLHSDDFPGFSFCLMYPRCGAEEASNLGIPRDADKGKQNKTNKSLFFLAKGLRRQPSKTENV